jgi:hypothetical protein
MSLFRLVYASTSLLGDEPVLAREQSEQILLVSRRNNEAAEKLAGAIKPAALSGNLVAC